MQPVGHLRLAKALLVEQGDRPVPALVILRDVEHGGLKLPFILKLRGDRLHAVFIAAVIADENDVVEAMRLHAVRNIRQQRFVGLLSNMVPGDFM